jgi:hypothetical protein
MRAYSVIFGVLAALALSGLFGAGPALAGEELPLHLTLKVSRACDEAVARGELEPVGRLTRTKLMELSDAPCRVVQTCAIYALGELGDPRAVEGLRAKLASPSPHVRRIAASALGKIADPRAVPQLIGLAQDRLEQIMVRCASVHALGRFQDMRAVEALQRLARQATSPVQVEAIHSLHRMEGFLFWSAR